MQSTPPDHLPMNAPQPITAPAATLRELLGPEHRGILAGLLTLVFFVAFEAIAVATAMPVIATSLHGLSFYAWGFSAFVVGQMVGTVAGGRWTDRFGPTMPLIAGSSMFAIGLLVAGLAPVMGVFVLGQAPPGPRQRADDGRALGRDGPRHPRPAAAPGHRAAVHRVADARADRPVHRRRGDRVISRGDGCSSGWS